MKSFKLLSTLASAGLLLQACGAGGAGAPTATATYVALPEPQNTRVLMRLQQHLANVRATASYVATNEFSVENTMNDPADGQPRVWFTVNERRASTRSEIALTINTERRLYQLDGSDSAQKLYVKGPSPDLGIADDGWYVTSDATLIEPRINGTPTRVLVEYLGGPDSLDAAFSRNGSETIEGQRCDSFVATHETLPAEKIEPLMRLFSRADSITFTVLMCADGLLRRLHISGAGMGLTDKSKPAHIDIRLTFSGFGQPKIIEAPVNARDLDDAQTANTAPAGEATATSTPTPESVAGGALVNMNDGSYGTDEPMIGVVTDLGPVTVDNGALNYMSRVPLKELLSYYRAHYTQRGLTERTFVTSEFETGFSLVFDGLPDGAAMVVQATALTPNRVNVNISKRAA